MNTTRLAMLTVCAAAAAVCGTTVRAEQETHFKIYGGAAYVAPMSDSDVTIGLITETVKAEEQVGWNLGIEGRINEWFGIELDYVDADQDVNFGGVTIGEANFSPLTATFNIHVVHTTVVDFYIGPSYSYVNWGDIHLNASGSGVTGSSDIGTDSSSGWGLSLGLDIGFGKLFAIQGGLKYLDVDLATQSGQTYAVKPLVARLGVAFRF